MDKKPEALNTKNDDGMPIWPRARIIDGYAYELHSTHVDMAAAQKAVEAVRESGDAAQAFASGRPKFMPAKVAGTYFAHAAAVYTVPAGKLGTIVGNKVTWADRPPRVPPTPKGKAAKKGAKSAKKDDVETPIKEKVKARLAREKAEAEAARAASAE